MIIKTGSSGKVNDFAKFILEPVLPKIDKFTNYSLTKWRFKKKLGYELNLQNPRTFNEKIVWKKLNDRNPLLPIVADKYRV
ncbi:MAG: hypothetical protein ACOX3A_05915 [bacterium]